MDIALRDGTPANRLVTDLKQYLKYPDKLFRRVRDEHGQLQLSKRAKEFHPGHGVYRSSYKNARRLAVTETNMAYHKADNERWRQLDFVLGYEVQVSGTNSNVCPLCMELAGKYPKEFEFVGWHPHCRCHAVPIMEDIDSFQARQDALLRGERIPATGQVTAPPKNFTDHLANNSDRLQRASKAGTLPYFVRDNYKVGKDGTLTPTFASKAQDQDIRRGKKQEQEVFQYRKKVATQEQQAKAKEPALVAKYTVQKEEARKSQKELLKVFSGKKTQYKEFGGRSARFVRNSVTENLRYGELYPVKREILYSIDDYTSQAYSYRFEDNKKENKVRRVLGYHIFTTDYLGSNPIAMGRKVELFFEERADHQIVFHFIKLI